jgi:hypothetical protein
MPHPQFDRSAVRFEPLSRRENKKEIEKDHVPPGRPPGDLPPAARETIAEAADRVRQARKVGRPVMVSFGAHAIKNGLGPVFIKLIEGGWVTHLATNGAAIIHDWEFAFQGKSCEHVGAMVKEGRFGNWEETGYYINLAINLGVWEGRGYGESVGAFIQNECLSIPPPEGLEAAATGALRSDPEKAAVAADLLGVIRRFKLKPGRITVPHPWKRYSAQAAAFRLGVPFTGHPMFGHDIIYNHPMNHGGFLGRAAQRDFLAFAENVSRIDGGVYLSIGSAVMSPMIFEKSLSLAQNLAVQRGTHIDRHYILVVDLAETAWDWSTGEPPEDNPAYYLRYNKTFSRMGGTLRTLKADNRTFLLALYQALSRS